MESCGCGSTTIPEGCDHEVPFPLYLSRQGSKRFSPSRGSFRRHTKPAKRVVRRLIKKDGTSTIFRPRIPTFWDRYIRDLGNTLVNSSWRWTVILLSSSFILSWVLFAILWMIIANANGDLDPESTRPCLFGIEGFGGYVLFSIETQHTIGYGSRFITHFCPEGTFLMCLQVILGCAICGAMVSVVNAKMAHPLLMYSKNLFSKNAVISMRDGDMCLIFRVRDEQGRYSIGTSISAYLVQSRPGEPFLKSLQLEPVGILIWPLEIIHRITPSSPFWDLSAKELITKRFEIIATMAGTSSVTAQCSQTRTSYLSNEILWGCRYKQCVQYDNDENRYFVDHSLFNATEQVLTHLCSPQRLQEVIEEMVVTPETYAKIFNFTNSPESPGSDNGSTYDNVDDENEFFYDGYEVEVGEDGASEEEVDLEVLMKTLEMELKGACKETTL